MIHDYEVPMYPTPAQKLQLTRLYRVGVSLAHAAQQSDAQPDLHTCRAWCEQVGMPQSLVAAIELESSKTVGSSGALNFYGSSWVSPLTAGSIHIAGVDGEVRVAVDTHLPAWAREVLAREYQSGGEQALLPAFPSLAEARRRDVAGLLRQSDVWWLELSFSWDAYAPWDLTWTALDMNSDPVRSELMGSRPRRSGVDTGGGM